MQELDIPEIKIDPETSPSSTGRFPRLNKKIILITLFVLIFLGLIVVLGIVMPLSDTISSGRKTYQGARLMEASIKNQDIVTAQTQLQTVKADLAETEKNFSRLAWTKHIPFLGAYTSDGQHMLTAGKEGLDAADVMFKAILPYADLLGLKGKGTFAGGTTEERIATAIQTLDKVTPQVDVLAVKMETIRKEVDQIDPARYPETFQGKPVRAMLVDGKNLVATASELLTSARPMIKKLPQLVGAKEPQRFLILFQNDAELRPTGGFLTAYAYFTLDKGKMQFEGSDDIYKLDNTITKRVTPPEPISLHLGEKVWYIRNSNFSPDFKESMQSFEDIYANSSEKKDYAGIIAVDTDVLVKIMDVIGPVTAYGINFTTANVPQCDCPMVIWELEKYADEPTSYERGNRKDIIGVLLSEVMKKTLTAPKQLLVNLAPVILSEVQSKHVLVYFKDPDAQAGIEAIGGAGRIEPTVPGVDYLHISNANLGGAKSNLYVQQEVTLTVDTQADKTTNNLVIEYNHPRQADNCSLERVAGLCLSGQYRDYVRVYLPLGSKKIEIKGFETKESRIYEDLGHTVMDGYLTVMPKAQARVIIKYETPVKVGENYRIFLQKQPGTRAEKFKVTVDGQSQEVNLATDTELVF